MSSKSQTSAQLIEKIREQCLKALREHQAYRRVHPEAFQVWACSERKGAARLARKIARLIRQNRP